MLHSVRKHLVCLQPSPGPRHAWLSICDGQQPPRVQPPCSAGIRRRIPPLSCAFEAHHLGPNRPPHILQGFHGPWQSEGQRHLPSLPRDRPLSYGVQFLSRRTSQETQGHTGWSTTTCPSKQRDLYQLQPWQMHT